ncbi:MAG: amino acid ABC transporter substrate-binding protein [Acidimicrobiales bacterium]
MIGASLSLSGDFAADGTAFQRGYSLWVHDVNCHGGLLGRPVKLDILSDASSPTQVVTNYEKLISSDHVNLVFGPFSTFLTVPSSKVAHRYGYAFFEGAGGGPSVFAQDFHDLFDASVPVIDDAVPFAKWIASMPASTRPKTAAYPTSNDPFTQPVVEKAKQILEAAGVKTVYYKVFPAEVSQFAPIADQVARTGAQVVVLGSVDVPSVSAFIQAFIQQRFNPKAFIATSGPDQGAAFVKAIGASNTEGIMVPNDWYPGYADQSSQTMVKEYVAKYGGTASSVNADVAEAYSVGQLATEAVTATHSIDNAKLIQYLHSGVTLHTVQGPAKFGPYGENMKGAVFAFQWQHGKLLQVLPANATGSSKVEYPKPSWGAG